MDRDAVDARLEIPLRGGRALVLLPEGVRHPRSFRWGGELLTPYPEITHLVPGSRWIRIGTRRGVVLLPRAALVRPEDGSRLLAELLLRISQGPEGVAQMARMAAVEERHRHPASLRATPGLMLLCVAVFVLQLLLDGRLEEVAAFGVTLGRIEPWRFVTGNLLHATWVLPHLPLNLVAIFVFGALVERPLGLGGTLFVMAVSGLAAMFGSALAGLEGVVGASGIASGLVGAMLWLEFRHPADLPASWRVPRRLFVALVVLENAIMLGVPWIAVSGHLGGIAGGLAAAALVARPRLAGAAPRWLAAANAALALAVLASLGAVAYELGDARGAFVRRGERLLALEHAPAPLLNDLAWLIAISEQPTRQELELALQLAQRAVDESGRVDANILDTLAEVHFQLGQPDVALEIIDEAIRLEPAETYFREQRRRFRGERAPEDRPDPPGLEPSGSDPGVRV